jgi:PAS domain S-box-containing protein
VWVEWHNKALFDESGIRTGHLAIGIDITKRKKAEEALKVSEKKLRTVLDATQESIYMFDPEGNFTMANTTGLSRLNNINENDLLGHHFSEFMPSSIARYRQEKFDKLIKTGKALEFTDERAERIYHHNFFPVFRNENVTSVVSYSTDITERKRSEDNLKASEDRFRTISESLTIIISITRISDATLSFVNEPFEIAFGFKKDKLLGKRYPDCFYFPNEFMAIREILKAGGTIDNQDVKVKKSDGSSFWIMLSVRKINFMNEPSYLCAAIDISESKRTQLELIRLNRTLNAHSKSSQTMMHSDNELNYINDVCKIIIEDCGHAMVWVGYALNDKKKTVSPVASYGFDQGYIDQLNITWDDSDRGMGPTGTAIRTGKPAVCKNMLTDPAFKPWRKAAIERGYASSLVLPLLSDGKSFGAVSIYSKEPDPFSEAEIDLLRILADDLAYGITYLRLAESEQEAVKVIKENENKLKELITTKDKFFNIVAHDLKNPFTSLLGSSELLYNNIDQMSADNIKKLALILNDSAKGGYSILQNLLDWSRSETGLLNFNPENINLRIVVNENLENVQLQVANKGISTISELSEDFFIFTDKNMINTVLRNLISNAVKYTYKKGTVVVRATKNTKECIITVKDSGIGIEKEKVETLFRLENSLSLPGTEKEQGTGLGLRLCKEFTERMGGRIWVESKEGKGSEFNFTIPVKK